MNIRGLPTQSTTASGHKFGDSGYDDPPCDTGMIYISETPLNLSSLSLCQRKPTLFKFQVDSGGYKRLNFVLSHVTKPSLLTIYFFINQRPNQQKIDTSKHKITLDISPAVDTIKKQLMIMIRMENQTTTINFDNSELVSHETDQDADNVTIYYAVTLEESLEDFVRTDDTHQHITRTCVHLGSYVNSMGCYFWNERLEVWDSTGCWVSVVD